LADVVADALQNIRGGSKNHEVGKDLDTTPEGRRKAERYEALELVRDATWIEDKKMGVMGTDGGEGLSKHDKLTPAVDDANRHQVAKDGLRAVLAKAMEEEAGAFLHAVDAVVMVTIKQLAVKYWMALLETAKLEKKTGDAQEAIDWHVALDLENVQVSGLLKMCRMSKKDH